MDTCLSKFIIVRQTAFRANKERPNLESRLDVVLRDILCASLSLDDGLSTIQNLAIGRNEDSELYYDVARAIEEIILRRPTIANAKLTELIVRLAFSENRTLPKLLMLFDTRYTSSSRLSETDILPDINALPILLDILGELSEAIDLAITLNLRPFIPFLTDQVLTVLESIYTRGHKATVSLAVHEVHYLTWLLVEHGYFGAAEILLNRLMRITKESEMDELYFEASLDEATVLTELGLYDESRSILVDLQSVTDVEGDSMKKSLVKLQLSVNETRDDSVAHELARSLASEATEMFRRLAASGESSEDELGLALLVVGSSILANGWREAVPQALERLEASLKVYNSIKDKNNEHLHHLFKCLVCLGFAHGLLGDHENMKKSIDYLGQAKKVLDEIEKKGESCQLERARCDNALGWICLNSESDEYWITGADAFERATALREELHKEAKISDLELSSSKLGQALAKLRMDERKDSTSYQEPVREILVQYVPLFPTDPRAFTEIAIGIYDIVWITLRHGGKLSPRLLRLVEDIDRMLSDARTTNDSVFIQGVFLIFPYLMSSWKVLHTRSRRLVDEPSDLSSVACIMAALSMAKNNIQAISLEVSALLLNPVDQACQDADPFLSQYWMGQTQLAKTIKAFFENKDYSEMATGLYKSAQMFQAIEDITPGFQESAEFILATSLSLSNVLLRFALALESHYEALIDKSDFDEQTDFKTTSTYNFLLAEDWLGLVRIAEAYLQMIEQSELVEAQPYLNAVFSNITRALKMMDEVALVDRRVLALLGQHMNRRYYLRS